MITYEHTCSQFQFGAPWPRDYLIPCTYHLPSNAFNRMRNHTNTRNSVSFSLCALSIYYHLRQVKSVFARSKNYKSAKEKSTQTCERSTIASSQKQKRHTKKTNKHAQSKLCYVMLVSELSKFFCHHIKCVRNEKLLGFPLPQRLPLLPSNHPNVHQAPFFRRSTIQQ